MVIRHSYITTPTDRHLARLGPHTGQCHRYRFTVLPSCSHNTHLIFVLIGGAVLVPADFGPKKKIGVLPQLLGFKHILNSQLVIVSQ